MGWDNHGSGADARRRILLAGVSAIVMATTSTYAQENTTADLAANGVDTSEVTLLDRITIVSRTGESAIEQMASVSHVGPEEIQRRQASTANDLLFGVPGVEIKSDARSVASSVNIRGLQDFGRVAVIIDGARQNFQRSDHGTQSMFFLDPELVQQVDVIRGPVANTYGSGAIGGVVAFETKDADDFLRPEETWGASTTARFDSNGSGWTTSAVGAYRFNENVDILGNIVYRDFGNYKDGDGNRVDGTGFDVVSGMLKSTIKPTENSSLKLGWTGANDDWREPGSSAYDVEVKQNTFTGRYNYADPNNPLVDLHINAAHSNSEMVQTFTSPARRYNPAVGGFVVVPAGSRTTYDLRTTGIDVWNTSRFDTGAVSHELTYGGDWLKDKVETVSPFGSNDVYTPSGNRTVWGLHIQDKLTYDWLEIIGGLRYDKFELDNDVASNSGDRVSPRLTVGISPFKDETLAGLQFYGTYAEGYRSPSTTETLMNGLHPSGVVFPFLPNPNLIPETGKTWEIGINYKRDGLIYANDSLRLKAAYFNNDIDDYIGLQQISAFASFTDDCNFTGTIPICYQYQNFASAKIRGFEMEAFYDAGHVFGGLSASIISGYTVDSDSLREDLLTIPSSQVTAQLGFRMLDKQALTIGGEVQYNGKPDGATYAEDYTLVNLFASYQATDNFRVDFRADNLLDETYTNPLNGTTTSGLNESGLTLKLGATMRFGG
ncbi:TonB-dependent hemoglobin/transferrin/lactoferrin family receptor [Limoniibacter endophyticus]|uniref:Ligand-gated channel n=1 Tax=Limoniibacter endophyticus TaxID=1565040 RepID=A0A8J3GJ43_9HYPH|nr:TonB-dependent hemoglobin/transferrin/lactoferrin family receptor [Limoniibacter endophyticus]GHC75725.1 ligand-gated channel [Limoniibacter endophyticus]